MNCPKCGSKPMDLPWNGWFECGSWKNPVSEDFFRNKICAGMEQLRKPLDAQIQQLESERDALQARVTTLQSLLDQRWEMMRELEEVCETKDVAKAVEYVKGLKSRVKKLEEAGDALQSAVVGVEGMTHWQWLATAHEADLKWRAAKETKP